MTVVFIALVVVLFVLGGVGIARAIQLRASGGRYSLTMSRSVGCIGIGVVLAIVLATVAK